MVFMRDLLTTTIRQCQVRAWNTKLGTVGLYGATTSESVSIHYSISENLFFCCQNYLGDQAQSTSHTILLIVGLLQRSWPVVFPSMYRLLFTAQKR